MGIIWGISDVSEEWPIAPIADKAQTSCEGELGKLATSSMSFVMVITSSTSSQSFAILSTPFSH